MKFIATIQHNDTFSYSFEKARRADCESNQILLFHTQKGQEEQLREQHYIPTQTHTHTHTHTMSNYSQLSSLLKL